MLIKLAASKIAECDAVVITAGAGMGADSGLATFRGKEGFYKHYPLFEKSGMSYMEAATPFFLKENPFQYWFFYAHRYNVYTTVVPHKGFDMLLEIGEKLKSRNYFVYTSNVDGHFQKAGFPEEKVVECHGSIHFTQCNICKVIAPVCQKEIPIDEELFVVKELPRCKKCNSVLRPNILMFEDLERLPDRTSVQLRRFDEFLESIKRKDKKTRVVIIEIGAGVKVPTIRLLGDSLLHDPDYESTLIRINLEDDDGFTDEEITDIINEKNIKKYITEKPSSKPKMIDIQTGGLPGISAIYHELKKMFPSQEPFI